MGKMQMPVTVCSDCGAHGYIIQLADRKCRRMVHGERCKGINQRALRECDWAECSTCAGTGFEGKRYCRQCDGSGWVFLPR
jgi:DnaJ-class molecular chaperone